MTLQETRLTDAIQPVAFAGNGTPPGTTDLYSYLIYQTHKYYLILLRVHPHDTRPLWTCPEKRSFLGFPFHPSNDIADALGNKDDLPVRLGERVNMVPWILPHREAPPYSHDAKVAKVIESLLEDVVSEVKAECRAQGSLSPDYQRIADQLDTGMSRLEGHGSSIILPLDSSIVRPESKNMFSEVAHIHAQDLSFHVNLAPKDAAIVIDNNWGERFAVSGRTMWIGRLKGRRVNDGYVLVYAPRTMEEVEIVKRIVKASIGFAFASPAN